MTSPDLHPDARAAIVEHLVDLEVVDVDPGSGEKEIQTKELDDLEGLHRQAVDEAIELAERDDRDDHLGGAAAR